MLMSKTNSEPPQAMDSTRSLSLKPDTSPSTTMLSQSEYESLMQETQQASQRMKAELASRKIARQSTRQC
ncbi:MAG: hypothetical protein RI907_994 [Pseudomonadota bacterium]|jgi:hypothetical protein